MQATIFPHEDLQMIDNFYPDIIRSVESTLNRHMPEAVVVDDGVTHAKVVFPNGHCIPIPNVPFDGGPDFYIILTDYYVRHKSDWAPRKEKSRVPPDGVSYSLSFPVQDLTNTDAGVVFSPAELAALRCFENVGLSIGEGPDGEKTLFIHGKGLSSQQMSNTFRK